MKLFLKCGVFEIQLFEPVTIAEIEVFGIGWEVRSVEGAADKKVRVPGLLRIPFRALPADASQPIVIAFTLDGRLVRRQFKVSEAAIEATKMSRLVNVA